ncbi:Com family DNA-binding transcriptional regulator [Ancylobacter lacus]|uniref:Com family DNA-binding transcriptional regulator n=1 Tax=Ancylobacter lacus TaxID=2579970 RepID=UPI001BCFDAEE|nr:Com family DNA-binding transcriptional regulator [Ancylobacter lacus]
MEEIRCGCGALLLRAGRGSIAGRVEIKCRRCGAINHLRPTEPAPERPERRSGDDACHTSGGKPSVRRRSISATPSR